MRGLTIDTTPTDTRTYFATSIRPRTSTGISTAPTSRITRADPQVGLLRTGPHVQFPPMANSTVGPHHDMAPDHSRLDEADHANQVGHGGAHYQPAMWERVKKWDLKFSGLEDQSLETFLRRLGEFQTTCGLNDADVLVIMPLVLTGLAKTWWMHRGDHIRTCSELRAGLRKRYGEPDIAHRILSEVLTRTQGPLEGGLDYLDALLAMWKLVDTPLPTRIQLDMAFSNLRSEYHATIKRTDFTTFEELYDLVQRFDQPRRRLQPRNPVTPNESILPDMAYVPDRYTRRSSKPTKIQVAAIHDKSAGPQAPKSPRSPKSERRRDRRGGSPEANHQVQSSSPVTTNSVAALNPMKSPFIPRDQPSIQHGQLGPPRAQRLSARPFTIALELRGVCFNCKQPGHIRSQCSVPIRVGYCWTCGSEGNLTPGCPGCAQWNQGRNQQPGNASRGQQ